MGANPLRMQVDHGHLVHIPLPSVAQWFARVGAPLTGAWLLSPHRDPDPSAARAAGWLAPHS